MLTSVARRACLVQGRQLTSRFIGSLRSFGSALETEGHSTAGLSTDRVRNSVTVHALEHEKRPTGGSSHDGSHAHMGGNLEHSYEDRHQGYKSSSSETNSHAHDPGDKKSMGRSEHAKRRRRSRSDSESFVKFDSTSRAFVQEMSLLAQHGRWYKALQTYREALQDGSTSMTIFMYNATISVLSKRGRWSEVLSVVEDMRSAGHSPDRYTYNIAIQACAKGNEPDRALALFEEMKSVGVTPDIFTYNHVMTSCRGGEWQRALDLMAEMEQAGHKLGTITFNALIVAYGGGGETDRALQVLDEMRSRDVARTEGTYCAAISACGKVGDWERALVLLDDMEDEDLVPNVYCYNATIAGGRWQEALALYTQFLSWENRDQPINPKQAYRVLQVCARAGAMDHVRKLVEDLRTAGHEVPEKRMSALEETAAASPASSNNRGSGNHSSSRKARHGEAPGEAVAAAAMAAPGTALRPSGLPRRPGLSWAPPYSAKKFVRCVRACGAGVGSDVVLGLLKGAMADPEIKVTMLMYQSVLEWMARRGKPDEAVEVLDLIRGAGLTPDNECVTWAIKACGRARPAHHERAMELAQGMEPPDVWGYALAMSACAKGAKWADSLSLLEAMPSVGLHANMHCYRACLSACSQATPGQWEKAVDLIGRMRHEGVMPDVVSYDLAIRTCLGAEQTEVAKTLVDEMIDAGFTPDEEHKRLTEGSAS